MSEIDPFLRIRVSGAAMTEDQAREVGQAFSDVLNAVAKALGEEPVVRMAGVRLMCDECEALAPALDLLPEDWTHDNETGRDYCATCRRPVQDHHEEERDA